MRARVAASLGLVITVGAVGVLTGCSSSSPASSSSPSDGKVGGSVTWWVPNWDVPVATKLVADFEEKNPGTTVKIVETTADTLANKVNVALNSGTTPDVITELASRTPTYIEKDQLANLDDLYGSSMPKDDFLPGTLDTVSVDDKAYGVPFRWDNLALIYNKDLFDAAGISEPPTTLKELKADAEKLTTGSVSGIGWQLGNPDTTALRFFGLAASASDDPAKNVDGVAELTKSSTEEALEIMAGSVRDGWASKSSLESDSTGVRQLFVNGQIAMYLGGVYDLKELQEKGMNVGTALAPGFDGPSRTAANGWVYLVPSAAKNKDAAKALVTYLTEVGPMADLTLTFPARLSASDDPKFDTELGAPFLEQLTDYAVPAPRDPSWYELLPTLFSQVQAVAIGTSSAEDAAKAIQTASEAASR